ncbi:MAG: hypothetical protein KBA50_07055 [Sedimentibacter sp.]|nr:hypothetical protein [Sedimentibacter sp.]HNZ83283.1 GDSL-type esterase/lipase family protein [Sedimentibacter sp.]
MNKRIKRWLPVILVLIFAISSVTPALAAPRIPDFVRLPDQAPAVINYVALGDSNAAGVRAMSGELPGWEEGSDCGYTDLIAKWLFDEGFIDSFNEDYSISGNTAAKLARATSSKAYKNLVHADIVTLTIGANDFLEPFYAYFDSCTENRVPIDPVEALLALKAGVEYFDAGGGKEELQANVETILRKTLKASKDVKVYVMGYYNPLPILIELAEQGIVFDLGGVSADISLDDLAFGFSNMGVLGMDYEVFVSIPPEKKLFHLNSILDQLLPTLLPSLSPELQELLLAASGVLSIIDLAPQVMKLNDVLEAAIDAVEAKYPDSIEFIETLPIVNGYSEGLYKRPGGHMFAYGFGYLYADISNPLVPMADIHLTEDGYAAVAALFEAEIDSDFGLSIP